MNDQSSTRLSLSPILLLTLLLAGCGGGPKAVLIPAKGIVKIDGKPAADIRVMAVPKTVDKSINAPTCQGHTDSEGKFELFTLKEHESGAMAGPTLFTLFDDNEERPLQGEEATTPPRLDPSFGTKGIEIVISEGQEITIEATSPK